MNQMSSTRFLMLVAVGIGCTILAYAGMQSSGIGANPSADISATPNDNEPIYQLKFTDDETAYFSRSRKPGIFLRDLESGDELAHFDYKLQIPATFDLARGDQLMVVAYRNHDVVAWEGTNRNLQPRRLYSLSHVPFCSSVSGDGRYAVFGCDDGWIEVVDVVAGKRLIQFSAGNSTLRCLQFAPQGDQFLASNDAGQIRLYEATTGRMIREYPAHVRKVKTLDWSADGKHFVSGGHDGAARLWNREQSDPVWTIQIPVVQVANPAISADGKSIVVAGGDCGSIYLCDVTRRSMIETGWGQDSSVNYVCFARRTPKVVLYSTLATTSTVHRMEVTSRSNSH